MATSPAPQTTSFTRDVLGRYVCNGLDEALGSVNDANGNVRPDTRPFDVIIIGGGSFGPVVAQHLLSIDKNHRILVLEAGPLLVPEHVQNLPMLGLNQPVPATADPGVRNEVWGFPWISNDPTGFPGLAYCLGGRSLYWGGWSPRPLNPEELPPAQWPASVIAELNNALPNGRPSYFRQASEQLAIIQTNDFIFGPLHTALRQRLFDGITANPSQVPAAIPLAQLPLHLDGVPPAQQDVFKLEAPLAVEGTPPRSGFFPLSKFSALPLLIKAARAAQGETNNDDGKKRLMVVPNCHVTQLVTSPLPNGMQQVTAVATNKGQVPVPPGGVVVIALGTIESARLAHVSFVGIPNYNEIGKNLMAHLRSNLAIRVPRNALPANLPQELQASALFVKGQHTFADGTTGYFHLQITAAGLGALGTNAEVELFQTVPDIDTFDVFRNVNDTHVVIHIRAIGEMQPNNPESSVSPDPNDRRDEFNIRKAFVALADPRDPQVRARNPRSAKDFDLWNTMDAASDDVATVLSGGNFQVIGRNRDGLGTTHHEAGTLRMGQAAANSVTNPNARFHQVPNAYAAGPALFPTGGSPNPMLTGVALARRLADHLTLNCVPDDVAIPLFDGSTQNWRMSTIRNQPGRNDSGSVMVVNGTLETIPGNDIGLFWCTTPTPPDFILTLEWVLT